MKHLISLIGLIGLTNILMITPTWANYRVQVIKKNGQEKVLQAFKIEKEFLNPSKKLLRQIPYFLDHSKAPNGDIFEEYEISSQLASGLVKRLAENFEPHSNELRNSDVRVLVNQGPKENRINLTILGDGYTIGEREKFFEDCARTVHGLFETPTFKSYLPLFNVYAVFTTERHRRRCP